MGNDKVESIGGDYRVDKLFNELWAVIEQHHGLTYAAVIGVTELVKDRLIVEMTYDYDNRD